MNIQKRFSESLPENIYSFYSRFRTTHADEFLERFMESQPDRPHCAIEIGTGNGLSTLVLAKYCNGIVFTFDVAKRNADFIWSFFPELRPFIYSVVGSQHYIDESIRHLKEEGSVIMDFAFIDGEHDRKSCMHDFELLKSVGIKRFLFHDVNNPEIAGYVFGELGAKQVHKLYGYLEVV
jgi:predicted O-methyltransferase YrrM